MKIGYFGSPEISSRLLDTLVKSDEHEVVYVVSNPDKPRGRSSKMVPTEVSQIAIEQGIPLYRFQKLKKENAGAELAKHDVDINVVFAYGKLLPEDVYDGPPKKSINLHGSVLPLLRGASPIQTAILNGFSETGWTVQMVGKAMDEGDVIGTALIPIDKNETTEELTEKMMPAGIQLMMGVLATLDESLKSAQAQNHNEATTCSKLTMEMSEVDWSRSTREIHDQVRAMHHWPVARSGANDKVLKIFKTSMDSAETLEADALGAVENQLQASPPGGVVVWKTGKKKRLLVKTGDGLLEILEVQPQNKKQMKVQDFLNGFQFPENSVLKSV